MTRRVTLIAGILVLVCLGIFAHLGHRAHVAKPLLRERLLEMRFAIQEYCAFTAAPDGKGGPYPNIAELRDWLGHDIPDNPFSTGNHPNQIIISSGSRHEVTPGTEGAWRYDPDHGQIWADTNSGFNESNW